MVNRRREARWRTTGWKRDATRKEATRQSDVGKTAGDAAGHRSTREDAGKVRDASRRGEHRGRPAGAASAEEVSVCDDARDARVRLRDEAKSIIGASPPHPHP